MDAQGRARPFLALVAALAVFACAEAPVAPAADALAARAASSTQGVYDVDFRDHTGAPVTTLPVMNELVLAGHVEAYAVDGSGAPATRGTITFQYCSYPGPANDISRADEAPSSECASGAASWANLRSVRVDASGNAFMNFGYVQIPRTIGFRIRYANQGGPIASGTSAAEDFTWTP
jgi:hypothetical protein